MIPKLIVLYGAPMVGKTTFLTALCTHWQQAGYSIRGVLSPAMFENGQKTGIQVQNLRNGEVRFLAQRRTTRNLNAPAPGYAFDEQNLQWADSVLADSVPTQILVIDEMGPLEIRHHQGWQSGIRAVLSYQYELAVIVLRESLHDDIRGQWRVTHWIEYQANLPMQLFDQFLTKDGKND